MGQCGPGRVFYFMADNKIPFLKPPLSVSDQTALLQSRGLIIPDLQRAKRYLSFVGYYRLAIYGKAFQIPDNPTHSFLPGTTFDNVWNLYPESVNKCCQRCWLEISTIFFENPGDFRPENFQLKDNCRFASSENRLFAVFRRTTPRNAA